MAEEPRLTQHGGKRTKGQQIVRQYGTSKAYIVSRLQREGLTHLVAAIESGRVSAFAIATQFGWASRRPTLGTGSSNQTKRLRHQLATVMREGRRDVRR